MNSKEKKEIIDIILKKTEEYQKPTTIYELKKEHFFNNLILNSYCTEKDKPYMSIDFFDKTVSFSNNISRYNNYNPNTLDLKIFLSQENIQTEVNNIVDSIKYNSYTVVFFYSAIIEINCEKLNEREKYDESIIDDIKIKCKKKFSSPILVINDSRDELYIYKEDSKGQNLLNAPVFFKHDFNNFASFYSKHVYQTDSVFENKLNEPVLSEFLTNKKFNRDSNKDFWNNLFKIFIKNESNFMLNKFGEDFKSQIFNEIKTKINPNDFSQKSCLALHLRNKLFHLSSDVNKSEYVVIPCNFYDFFSVKDDVIGVNFYVLLPATDFYAASEDDCLNLTNKVLDNIRFDNAFPIFKNIIKIQKNNICDYTYFQNLLCYNYDNTVLTSQEDLVNCFSKINIDYNDWIFYQNNFTENSHINKSSQDFLINIINQKDNISDKNFLASSFLRKIFKELSKFTDNKKIFDVLYSHIINHDAEKLDEMLQMSEEKIHFFIECSNNFIAENKFSSCDEIEVLFCLIKFCDDKLTINEIEQLDDQIKMVIVCLGSHEIKINLKKLLEYKERVIYAQGKSEDNWGVCFSRYVQAAVKMLLNLSDENTLYSNTLDMDTDILNSAFEVICHKWNEYLLVLENHNIGNDCCYVYKEKKYYISPCQDLQESFDLNIKLRHNMGLMVSEVEDEEILFFKITDSDNTLRYILKYNYKEGVVDSICGVKNSRAPKDEEKIILSVLKFK